jgi:glycosyltransferase involved in cell wall biosynthesis
VDALGLSDLVEFRGRRERAEVAAALREADLLAVPSRWETFSVATAEALCSGLPVLATDVGALPELVDEASGVLVAPGDARALAGGLERMLDTARGHDRAAIAARAAERYGRDAVGRAWNDVYRGLASE